MKFISDKYIVSCITSDYTATSVGFFFGKLLERKPLYRT